MAIHRKVRRKRCLVNNCLPCHADKFLIEKAVSSFGPPSKFFQVVKEEVKEEKNNNNKTPKTQKPKQSNNNQNLS